MGALVGYLDLAISAGLGHQEGDEVKYPDGDVDQPHDHPEHTRVSHVPDLVKPTDRSDP